MAQNRLQIRRKNIDNNDKLSSQSIYWAWHLIPGANNLFDLGSSSYRWRSIYAGTSINSSGTLTVDGAATFGSQIYQSTEHISVAGGSSGNPNANFVYTFVTTTGTGTATGVLANGLVESQRKILIAESLAVPYQLTVTNVVDPALGIKNTETFYLISAGDRIELVWNASVGAWFIDSQSVPDTLNVYVSASGSDSNNGLTSTTPVATLQRAVDIAHRIGWRVEALVNVIGTVTVSSDIILPAQAKGVYPQRSFTIQGDNTTIVDTMTVTAVTPVGSGTTVSGRVTITASGSNSFATGALNGHLVIFTSGALANTEIMILDHVALGGGSHRFKLTGLVGSVVVGDTFDVYQLTSVLQFNASNVRIYSDTPLRFHYIRFVIDNTFTFRSRGVFMLIGSAIFPSTTGSGPITINCTCETVQAGGIPVTGLVICGNPTRNVIVNINTECNNFTVAGLGASYTVEY
jgi:hypothetical protein